MKTNILYEVSTADLIDELMDRCNTGIFIGTRNEGGIDGDTSWYEFKGDLGHCYGLCHHMIFNLLKELKNQEDV